LNSNSKEKLKATVFGFDSKELPYICTQKA